jgi:polyamine oxidase
VTSNGCPDRSRYSDFSSIETFNETGPVDFASTIEEFNSNYYAAYEQNAGYTLTENLEDTSVRSAFSIAGWKPKKDPISEAVEWWIFDWEYSFNPEQSSALFSVVNYNTTFYQYSEENNFVFDPRGFNTFIKGEASTFLTNDTSDPRLKLNTIVTNITYTNTDITIQNSDDTCISAAYAICTFSLGVLQNDVVTFSPPLPPWKERAISTFSMGTYTKIFMQWPPDQVFWNTSTQFFLYADPIQRGWYPLFQSLDSPDFLPGSGILFCTVVHDQSYKVEAQDDEITKEEVLAVLRNMFGAENVPLPTAFMYPRWSLEPWAYGSYSNWPPGTSLQAHQNLRANVGRLFFAGEATSAQYYGFLHGAYFEGVEAGRTVAECVLNGREVCGGYKKYEALHGMTEEEGYNETNGWAVSSFQTAGFYGSGGPQSQLG